ncbi:hypothetical protein EJ06DRAFT_24183 [Trichodelitschia bisporula]|uniref:Zinc finger C2H2 LYAR-type domain-containing protein n=1 Tax=Trichodelitschia bisporula TaxID=703511 RepID=A0A6G1IAS1_9PEZI|nr:hypothetical protein EJ06DRAFT_24183 [Trichodelitschia bisporula]
MVSFSCEGCGDVLTKKKLDSHKNHCYGAEFTCLDCMVHFRGVEYRAHTSCVSEAQKYQGALYKDPKNKKRPPPVNTSTALVPRDAAQDKKPEDRVAIVDAPPPAPSPPPMVNVFQFMVDDASAVDDRMLPAPEVDEMDRDDDTPGYYPAYPNIDAYRLPDSPADTNGGDGKAYQTPAPRPHLGHMRTISQDSTAKKKRKRGEVADLDVAGARAYGGDVVMTDVPSLPHSGLTGGMNRLLSRQELPPSPDYSGGDGADRDMDLLSPIKKPKQHHGEEERRGREKSRSKRGEKEKDKSKPKDKKKDKSSKSKDKKEDKKEKEKEKTKEKTKDKKLEVEKRSRRESDSRHSVPGRWERRRTISGTSDKGREAPRLKAIEYHPDTPSPTESGAMIVRPRAATMALSSGESSASQPEKAAAEMFLAYITKGPDSERGLSVNKALKRWRRDRTGSGRKAGEEEKELWRALRVRRNETGEVVLFV